VGQLQKNTLFYGDNLPILQEHIADESVDLIYLDPPFNSNRSYNVLFKDEGGKESPAQVTAFEDTWHWHTSKAEQTYTELVTRGGMLSSLLNALRQSLGTSQMMTYLVMMAARLAELHRVLKPTGSLYLHCDPTASHYLKMVLDTIFGVQNFRNEIIWKRQSAHSDSHGYGSVHDIILFYVKSNSFVWNQTYQAYDADYVEQYYRYTDEKGRRFMSGDLGTAGLQGGGYDYEWKGVTRVWRVPLETMQRLDREGHIFYTRNGIPRIKRYLDEAKGMPVQDLWIDLESLRSWHAERLGYPTQKPVALLERIIEASSNAEEVVLDPFCGCGTTIAAAQKLGRRWIGIDITHLAIALQKYRLKDSFGLVEKKDYTVIGEPEDLPSAQQLAQDDRYQFQWWALSLVKARPLGDTGGKQGKKGSDKGIDGIITFIDDHTGKAKQILAQVKSGKVKSGDIRDLRGVLDRENAAMGIFITLEPPTRDMLTEAVSTGYYHSPGWDKDYPKLQILAIGDLLNGAEVKMPPTSVTFKQAERVKPSANQQSLF
jgi:site-specific DNA-methyltransferase (adenine-specific)